MERGKIVKPVAVALGCAGAAVAAPFLAPYLATVAIPFFGAVLAGVFKADGFTEKFGQALSDTAAGFLTGIGGSAIDKIPGTLGDDHNFHLEKMLATAYLESLAAIEREIKAGADERLQEQAAQVFPLLKARIERGLRAKELFLLFPLQAKDQSVDKAFANRFSAEKISLLIADEERWREQLGDEVEIALRRWLNEERAARQKQLGLSSNAPLPEPLRSRLRAELPHRIAHRISELVKRDDFKESWIAFQRAHLQGMVRVVERIETSQADIKGSVDALAKRIEGFANQDAFVTAIAGKLEEFLSKSHLPQEELALMLDRQSDTLIVELRGLEERLDRKMDENKGELIGKISEATNELKQEFQQAVLQGAIRAAQRRLKQLPAPPRDFIGREAELDELRQELRQRGVTIAGMGGVGKTALALKLAHECKDRYADAQIYLDLKGVSQQPLSHAEVMWHVVSSFQPEMKRPDDEDLPGWYNALLNEHRVLLFYDNAKDAAQIAPLLPPENCLLLVTSRKHFTLPEMFDKNLDEMTEADAKDLLLKIAPRIATDAAAIAELCGHLPIALRAAASALKAKQSLTPADYLQRLHDEKERLKLHDAIRNLTVDACFSLSYELLTGELPRRWRMLAIFPATFDAPAAAAIWQTEIDDARKSLEELEEYSLLEWEEAAKRYNLHDLARDFADTRLSATEREQAGLLHAAHYLQILATANSLYLKGNEAVAEGLSLFDSERVNVEAGQEWAAARFDGDEQAARLCNWYSNAGVYVLDLRQHPRDFIRWQEAALHAAGQLNDRRSEGNCLGNLGIAYDRRGETRTAIDYHRQALAISRELGDQRGEGSDLGNLGIAYGSLGEARTAIDYYQQALAISRELGDRRSEGNHLGNLGIAYGSLGEVGTAIDYFQQALAISRELGDQRGEGHDLGNLGNAYANIGEVGTAIDYYQQALVIAREIGDKRGEGNHLGNLGLAYVSSGEIRTTIDYYQQALAILREIGDRRGEGNSLSNLGLAYAGLSEADKAIEFMEAALKIFEEIESPNASIVRRNLEKLRGKRE